MARDAELDRLKAAQELAFQRKQDAYDAMQKAWDRRSSARDELNRAHEAKQNAYANQDRTWQRLQAIRGSNGPRIESLNSQQESAYQNMKRSFESASSAFERGDKASAKSYVEEGHRYKAESQGYVAERRRLVEDIRRSRAEHEAMKPAFERSKEDFASAKRKFDAEKALHERAQRTFNQAKTEFDRAQSEFRSRLEKVKAETAKRKDSKRAIAEKAGVPIQYRDNVWISTEPDGTINIYFGGVVMPNGPGHGHYVMEARGNVTYKRDPFDPHGSQNFTDSQLRYEDIIELEIVRGAEFGFWCKFRGYDAYVESNINREGRAKIDIYYGPSGPFGPGHHHAVAYRDSPFHFVADNLR